MVPPVRSRAARFAVPPGVSAETPAIEKGSWQGRQALTEGLWVSSRNGLPVASHLLLHPTYNPSASHSLSTSPYTGEARSGRMQPARTTLPGGKRWEDAARSHHFAGRQEVGGRSSLAPLYREARGWDIPCGGRSAALSLQAVCRSAMITPHPTARPRPPPDA